MTSVAAAVLRLHATRAARGVQHPRGVHELFRKFAHRVSAAVGTAWAFLLAMGVIVVWAVTGPLFHYSDTWQLVINTGTTIVTFLMVFLIQNTQNRDARALHLKLDELLRGVKGARTSLVDLESLSDAELDRLQNEFARLRGRRSSGVGRDPSCERASRHAAAPTQDRRRTH